MIELIRSHLPERVLGNDELAVAWPDWSAQKIYEKTGIRERRIAGPGECASDLALSAANRVLLEAKPGNVDLLVLCTQSPDFLLPSTACVLQDRLKLPTTCAAFDFNLGCSGYIYGLAIAQGMLAAQTASTALLLTADTYTKFLHPDDRSTRTIFGDAATATLMQPSSANRLHSFVFGTDGAGAEQLILRQGGCRAPGQVGPGPVGAPVLAPSATPGCLFMNGPEVFSFTIKAVPTLIQQVLRKAGLGMDQIDLFVFHQANAYMLEHLRRRLGIPPEKFELCLERVGNTVSSTIPIALESALASGRLKRGMKVLLAGFGVGFSWGGCILEWNAGCAPNEPAGVSPSTP